MAAGLSVISYSLFGRLAAMNCLDDLKDFYAFYAFYDFYGFYDFPLTARNALSLSKGLLLTSASWLLNLKFAIPNSKFAIVPYAPCSMLYALSLLPTLVLVFLGKSSYILCRYG